MSIKCPRCDGQTKAIQVDAAAPKDRISRVRSCDSCCYTFTTHETVANRPAQLVKRGPVANAVNGVHPAIKLIADTTREKGVSLSELGFITGSHAKSISRWIRGNSSPSLKTVEDTLNALGFKLKTEKIDE